MDGFLPASQLSVVVFVAIVVAVIAAILWMIQRAYQSVTLTVSAAVGLGCWIGILAAAVATGRMEALPQHGLPFFFGAIVVVWTAVGLSPIGAQIADEVPIGALVAFQGFRLPLEFVLHSWASQGTIPGTMTWTGQNWDVITGVVAIACAPMAARSAAAAWAANLIGAALLVNVARVAILSSPVSFGWDLPRPLLVAFHLPYALIGPVCVGGALFGHLVLTRALLRRR